MLQIMGRRPSRVRSIAEQPREKDEPASELKANTAVPRYVRLTEQQIDRAAEVKPLPPRLPE